MKKSAVYSDLIFAFLIAALPALCYLRFLRLPLALSILCATLVGGAVATLTALRLSRKREGVFLKRSERIAREKLALHLAILPPRECAELLLPHAKTILGEGEWECLFEGNDCFFKSEEAVALCRFQAAPLSLDDTLAIVRYSTKKKKLLLCEDCTGETKGFLAQLSIERKEIGEIYAALKKENALPQAMLGERVFDKPRKRRMAVYFARSNSRRCLVSGALLLLSSLIVPFPLYYRIFGGILLLCALLLRLYGVNA